MTDFEGGKLSSCEQLTENHFLLTTDAEDWPINRSPWYAFKVKLKKPGKPQKLKLTVAAVDARSRYIPKISDDGDKWRETSFTVQDAKLNFDIEVSDQVYVAAQEIIDNADYQTWIEKISASSSFGQVSIGESSQGRKIDGLIYQQPNNKEWILIIGRQHPPEVTGAMALLSFVEEIAGQVSNNANFASRFNILVIPNLNPDGVAEGNWRHNVNGIDLNRDWGKFTQKETQIVQQKLEQLLTEDQRLVFALDFHSTQQDIFYTMPTDYHIAPQELVNNWLAKVKEHSLSSFVVRPKPGTSPGRGVFKQYIADTYHVQAVTFEIGDNTQRDLIEHVGVVSAHTLVDILLKTPSQAFIYTAPNAETK
ncbi:hypothetical protein GLIP_2697 [Aliiglaciecola lipolytica E3]|uniref:Peptidase M14 domain-containing protein n=1 Tax=Aliiglaciecola lipolytica E3 TaxID=1127673 RepID=K6X3Y5_9ALTE|nr:hypothetical protein GLIP_2697 [Aliiglaciecola lipolytica E3]